MEGSCQQTIRVPVHQLSVVPNSVSLDLAAAVPLVALTCLQTFRRHHTRIDNGHVVIVGASGGVGHVAVQMARHAFNARQVTAVCSLQHAKWVESLGAHSIVDYHGISNNNTERNDNNTWTEIDALIDKHGPIDFVLDTVTSNASSDRAQDYPHHFSCRLSPTKGMYITIGSDRVSDWVKAMMMQRFGWNLFSSQRQHQWVRFDHTCNELAEIAAMMQCGILVPKIAARHEFSDSGVNEAFHQLLQRRSVGKHIMVLEDEDNQQQ